MKMVGLITEQEEKELIVAKIDCGSEHGNAILISTKHAVTVKHCVAAAYEDGQDIILFVVSPQDGNVNKIKAVIDNCFDSDNDEWVMLELEQEVDSRVIKQFAETRLSMFSLAQVYGYDANYRAEACWIELKSIGSIHNCSELIQDQIFQLPDSRESDFSGMSGSPIFQGKYIIGIVSQQKQEQGYAIDLRGISVKSSKKFMDKYGITIEKLPLESEREFEQPITTEKFQVKNKPIAVVDSSNYQGILSGKYMDNLHQISELHYQGNIMLAWEKLRNAIIELEQDSVVAHRVKAEYFMKMAIWYLEDRQDVKKAQKKFEAALAYDSDMDGSIFMALKQTYEGISNAEKILEPINSIQKLNIYIQICINTKKVDEAIEKYDSVVGSVQENEVTYYLLSIVELLRHHYNDAMRYIDIAIGKNIQVPHYHIMKANILYWQAIPEDVCLSDEIYPPLFCNGIIHLDEEAIAYLKEAAASCRMAYTFAVGMKNEEQIIQILGIWINILSVEANLNNEVWEPLQILQKLDSLNVTALLYSLLKNLELNESITVEVIEKRLKTDKNKIGYAIILIEFCIKKNNYVRAKQCLHEYRFVFNRADYIEYWYGYIAQLESEPKQLEKYQKELDSETNLDVIQKKRLSCLFLEKRVEDVSKLEETLLEIYSITQKRLDLMNIISFYRINMRWMELEKYSNILIKNFGDKYGCIYHIRALIQLEKYEGALEEIEELQNQQVPHTYLELVHDRMIILDRMGQYDKAIKAGETLVKEYPTERALIQLSTLYIRNGEPDRALKVLLEAEQNENLSTDICQRISVLYLTNDLSKAWKYAQKAVKLSGNDPQVMLWATDIANRSGHSKQAGEYYHEVFVRDTDVQIYQIKTLDEALKIMQQARAHAEEMVQQYEAGQLPAHLYVDSFRGNLTYGEFFYKQWNAHNMAPLEFGAHYYQDEQLKLDDKIGLDYSSCILLHEIGILDVLVQFVSEIYVSGDLFGIIDTELRKIPLLQQDFVEERIALLDYCEKLGAKAVKVEVEEGILEYGVQEQHIRICQYTATRNDALWITNHEKQGIRDIDVIEVLFRENQITECLYQKYRDTKVNANEENIVLLQQGSFSALLVDEDVLAEWKKFSLLETISKRHSILFLEDMSNSIRQEQRELCEKEKICGQLRALNEHLRDIRDLGKLKFYPLQDQKEDMLYSNMLMTLFMGAKRWGISVCIDDRVLTSYSTMEDSARIYNTFDIIRILYINGCLALEKYCDVLQILYDANVQYVLPNREYLLRAIGLSKVDGNTFEESRMLSGIRKNVLCALSDQSHISQEFMNHVRFPEREFYIFNLQRETGNIIQDIWQSSETVQKKCLSSNWILWHYSQFAFTYSDRMNQDSRKYIQAVLLADFLVKGMLITVERYIEKYYEWMYQWMDSYFDTNLDIKEMTLEYTRDFLNKFLRNGTYTEREKKEQRIIRWKMATAIHLMPEDYRKIILSDRTLLNMHDKLYSVINVVLTQGNQVPAEQFMSWEWEILACAEKEPVYKNFQGIDYELSWTNLIPALHGMIIRWEQNDEKRERQLYMERGKRLFHRDKIVRKAEFKYIESYLLDSDYSQSYLKLIKGKEYDIAAKEILALLDLSIEYEYIRIDYGLRNSWLESRNGWEMLLPKKTDYFKQFFDFESEGKKLKSTKDYLLRGVPIRLEEKLDWNCDDNHNPVRKIRQLAQDLEDNPKAAVKKIIEVFSYVDGENALYGRLYILLLKAIWKLFEEVGNYKDESEENRIIWSYLWADEAMTCVSRWILKERVNLAEFISSLENEIEIDIDRDDFGDNVESYDVLSPNIMNLFKLCITGVFVLCNRYKEQIGTGIACVLKYANEHIKTWLDSWINLREIELTHKDDKNVFNSIFIGNFFSIVGSLYSIIDENLTGIETFFCIDNRIDLRLDILFKNEKFTEDDLGYLYLLTRETRTENEIRKIESIIVKHVLEKDLVVNRIRYRILANVVLRLSNEFQGKFLNSEYTRISRLLSLNTQEWEEYCNLASELYQKKTADAFVCFLEQCVNEWKGNINLQFAEWIAQLQLFLPFDFSERLISLRIQYELKDD